VLSLNYGSCVVVAVGLVLLLAGAFALGRRTRPRGVTDGPADVAGTDAGATPAGLVGADAVAPAARPQRVSGKYYLIIQNLRGGGEAERKEGERIVAFCAERGEQATVEWFKNPRTGKAFLAVWSLTPFQSASGKENTAHAEWIETIGRKYFEKHRTHSFQQRLSKDGPLQPTYVKAP